MSTVELWHNIEVAHRLSLTPGKCQQIHGHSMGVTLTFSGEVDSSGLLSGIDLSDAKKAFRSHLDSEYDHRLLLNVADPLIDRCDGHLPGLRRCAGDPTIEHLAEWIGLWAIGYTGAPAGSVRVQETRTNAATWSWPATS